MTERAGSGALKRRGSRSPTLSATVKPAVHSVREEPHLVAGFDVAGARERGLPIDELAKLKAQSRYLGSYSWELGLDPHDLCPLCGEMFGGWCLHADHVMPEHFAALYRVGDQWLPVRDAEDVPEEAEVYYAVQCAAYTHAPCNLSKGRTADISAWRLPGLPPLIVAESDAGVAVAVPGPVIVPAEPRTPEQRVAEILGLQRAKTGSGSVRGRRLSIEERNREAQLAQQALTAHHQRRVSQQRALPDASSTWAFSEERRKLNRTQRRGDRSVLCNFLALRVYVGLRVAGTGWGDYVTRMPRASKLVGLVNPWAVLLSTCRRLLMPSMRPLEARSLWCQARISSERAMMVSTMMLLCLSSRDLGEVPLVALGEVAVVVEASFEC